MLPPTNPEEEVQWYHHEPEENGSWAREPQTQGCRDKGSGLRDLQDKWDPGTSRGLFYWAWHSFRGGTSALVVPSFQGPGSNWSFYELP